MQNLLLVKIVDSLCYLKDVINRFVLIDTTTLAQVTTLDVFHHIIGRVVGLYDFINIDNILTTHTDFS